MAQPAARRPSGQRRCDGACTAGRPVRHRQRRQGCRGGRFAWRMSGHGCWRVPVRPGDMRADVWFAGRGPMSVASGSGTAATAKLPEIMAI